MIMCVYVYENVKMITVYFYSIFILFFLLTNSLHAKPNVNVY